MPVRGVELFAGGGGLLLGSALAGVEHVAAAEWDHWASTTMRENAARDYPLVRGLNVIEGDVRDINWAEVPDAQSVDIVAGGPPCQPFSLGGSARSADDPRDMFPATTSVIEQLRPRAFVVENVKGLTRSSFSEYFEYIKLRLQHPELQSRGNESWVDHHKRLQREHSSVRGDLSYRLLTNIVDAADYGVPQHRHRVFMVGFRSDVDADWHFPNATHSASALLSEQTQGHYWDRHGVLESDQISVRTGQKNDDGLLPWVTVRDALQDMPFPGKTKTAPGWLDHRFQPGAKTYPGHTGSPLDEPSKALKAGVHGVPGGENMLRNPDGTVRYYSTREAARLQTFPDRYALHGAWSEAMRQLGNAVPVKLAETVMGSVVEHLELDAAKHEVADSIQRHRATELMI
ncbi:DNA cytosine methyltransferase [Galactobacter caseinivorans]|uniref:DNA (cytosine-5-)-methyltransferase n=1 Tax=Galactobacter caseinivorans TaxID=2676123 RepID=A0A496PHG7_9MICC|nr:DNA cytosine methyltransferase [Galactobacter caseinivorans]RKW69931.1 DNA (cytosine-5-)-methyltransferase [Galactobacter caseinivorans]